MSASFIVHKFASASIIIYKLTVLHCDYFDHLKFVNLIWLILKVDKIDSTVSIFACIYIFNESYRILWYIWLLNLKMPRALNCTFATILQKA